MWIFKSLWFCFFLNRHSGLCMLVVESLKLLVEHDFDNVFSRHNNTSHTFKYLVLVWIEFKQMRSDQLMVKKRRVCFVKYLKSVLNKYCVRLINWHQLANELSPICYLNSNDFINYFVNNFKCLLVSNSVDPRWDRMLACESNHVLIIKNCSTN